MVPLSREARSAGMTERYLTMPSAAQKTSTRRNRGQDNVEFYGTIAEEVGGMQGTATQSGDGGFNPPSYTYAAGNEVIRTAPGGFTLIKIGWTPDMPYDKIIGWLREKLVFSWAAIGRGSFTFRGRR